MNPDDAWWSDLPAETKAVIGVEETDVSVLSDGTHSWMGPQIYPPEMTAANPDPLVDPMEHWMWDCMGCARGHVLVCLSSD